MWSSLWRKSAPNLKSINQAIVVKRAWMYKLGDWLGGWQKRLFVLTSDKHLKFYLNETDQNACDSIDLEHLERLKINQEHGEGLVSD